MQEQPCPVIRDRIDTFQALLRTRKSAATIGLPKPRVNGSAKNVQRQTIAWGAGRPRFAPFIQSYPGYMSWIPSFALIPIRITTLH